jgi:hypothetical protein
MEFACNSVTRSECADFKWGFVFQMVQISDFKLQAAEASEPQWAGSLVVMASHQFCLAGKLPLLKTGR